MYQKNQQLSKSRFMMGLQCLKAIYLHYNDRELQTPLTVGEQNVINNGFHVGKVAQSLYPAGYDLTKGRTVWGLDLIEATQHSLQLKTNTLFEAAFSTKAGRLLCQTDILVKDNVCTKIIEVKSTTNIEDEHLYDLAYQLYVIRASGYMHPLRAFIAHLDNTYVLGDILEAEKLFKVVEVTDQVLSLQSAVEALLKEIVLTIHLDTLPPIKISESCFNPRKCAFFEHCWKDVPKDSVFKLGGIRKKKAFNLYNFGIIHHSQLVKADKLTDKQWIEITASITKTPVIDKSEISSFLDTVQGSLFYMDFETFMPPVPLYKGTRPYQQLCFQFCVTFVKETGECYTIDFVGEPGQDPRREFITKLITATQGTQPILVYNKAFEITRLNELKQGFTEFETDINQIIARVRDLMTPFQKRFYYSHLQGGSHSIKKVLPVLVPDLSYAGLAINNGEVAMAQYYQLVTNLNALKKTEKEKIIADLKIYCGLDVEAMVRIKESLENLIQYKKK